VSNESCVLGYYLVDPQFYLADPQLSEPILLEFMNGVALAMRAEVVEVG
jgi:hypothetical protein